MNYVNPLTDILSVTNNDIDYTTEYYSFGNGFISGVTDETYLDWSEATITAGSFVIGTTYTIVIVGTTDFTLIGASASTIGIQFTATGVGVGTGTAQTSYNINDFVIIPELKKFYKSTKDDNVGNYPALAGSTDWVEWGILNSYCAFAMDENIGSQTTGTDGVLELDFSKSNTIAGIDLEFVTAQMMQIKTDTINYLSDYNAGTTYAIDDGVVFNSVLYVSLVGSNLANTPDVSPTEWAVRNDLVYFDQEVSGTDYGALTYGEYFYTDATVKKRIVMTDFEWLPECIMRIELTGAFSIGSIVLGLETALGCTLEGSKLSFKDKSVINTDAISGYRKVIRYGNVRVLDCSVIFDTTDYATITQKAEEILSRNILWIPTDNDTFSEAIQIGYIENFDIPMMISDKTKTKTTIVGVIR